MKYKRILFSGLLFWMLAAFQLMAQQTAIPSLPIDPKVRYGKLDNGLTYYIRQNAQPKDRADFFIAQNVGSILEEENQRGLAHFLEHMAFDGTKNFPGHGMDDFTESIGMRGGENFNAYTSFDETVYMIMNAPVTNKNAVDSCLLILHDWSGFITLADTAIAKERNVIREEWRTRQNAQMRILEQQLPKILPDNRYAHRMPIGTIDVIENFKPDELRAYYKKWYRPDLQAIIIVGDVNVDQVETDIKKIFSDIPAPVNPAKREFFTVADNDEPLVAIATDKEASNTILSILYKHEKMPAEMYATVAGLVKDYMESAVETMINERFSEIVQKANPPFVAASASDGDFIITKTKGAFSLAALVKEGDVKRAMDALVTEAERIKRYGFTASEYERARTNILKQYESLFKDRDKQKNRSYTNEYVRHFTDGGYIPGIETEYALISQIAPKLPIEEINRYAKELVGDKNIIITLSGPEKEGLKYPTEAQLLADFIKAQQLPVEPYKETVSNEPLIPVLPTPGTIKESKVDPLFGATVMTLSNGVKVVLKHTDFKDDEILMTATSPGGSTLFGKKDIDNLKIFNEVIGLGGLGNFSATELNKILAGKMVSCSATLGLNSEDLNGNSTPEDVKTLFELIYLCFTAPRIDEEAYLSFEERMKAQLKNLELNPMVAFSDTLTEAIYKNNPRAARITAADFEHINYLRIMQMYKERFADASDFVFTFVGNLNIDAMRPYIEQYLATLPTQGRIEKGNSAEVPAIRKGDYTNIFKRKLETPKASVVNFWSGNIEYNLENILTMSMLKQVLDLVYMEKVREEAGGTYGVQTSGQLSYFPEGQTFFQAYFDTDPAKREQMNKIVITELENIAKSGPREDDFKKTKDNILKRHAENLQENSYWLNTLDNYYFRGFNGETNYIETLNGITPAKIQQFIKKLLKQGNRIEVVMESES